MSSRSRQAGIRIVPADEPEASPAVQPLPVLASSVFCDDVRMETTGKLMMIGCYPGNVILLNHGHTVDHLWIFTKILWPRDFDPSGMRLRVDLPAQEPGYMPVQTAAPISPEVMPAATCVWQVRFLPLRPGDFIRVGVECGGRKLQCGELVAAAQPQPAPVTKH